MWRVPAAALPIPHSHTDGWAGKGSRGILVWHPSHSEAARRGAQPEPSTMLTRIASFGKKETREPQLKCCFAVGITQLHAACCPLSPTELGQYFTELGNDLWAVSQDWNAHCLGDLEKYFVFLWLISLWKSLGWHAHCGKKEKKREHTINLNEFDVLGDCRNYKLEKNTLQITVFTEEMGRGFLRQGASENPKWSVATEKWEGATEKGSVEFPREARSSQSSLDSFTGVGWMLRV